MKFDHVLASFGWGRTIALVYARALA